MSKLEEKISDAELEIMQLLWDAGEPMPVADIRRAMQERRGWEPSTIKTLVARLVGKGVIRQEKRGNYYYSPLVTKEEYDEWATQDLIARLYRGSAKNLIAALVKSDELSDEDIDELREMLKGEQTQ